MRKTLLTSALFLVPGFAIAANPASPVMGTNTTFQSPGQTKTNLALPPSAISAPYAIQGSTIQSFFFGYNSGAAYPTTESTGYGSVGVGAGAFQSLSAANLEGTAVGNWACQYATTAFSPTCIGMHSGGSEITAPYLTLLGVDAMRDAMSLGELGLITAVGGGAIKHGQPAIGTTAVGVGALAGNSTAVSFGGTVTTGDTITIGIAASGSTPAGLTGLPFSYTLTTVGGDTLTTIALKLATAVNNAVTGPSYGLTTQANASPDGTTELALYFPGNATQGWALTTTATVGGAATETASVYGGTSAAETTAVGYNALAAPGGQGMLRDTVVGWYAGLQVTTGAYDALFGSQVGTNITTGTYDSVFGNYSGRFITTGNFISIFGAQAGNAMTTGQHDTLIGPFVGGTCATSQNVILLGTSNNTDCSAGSESNAIHIGAGANDIMYTTGTNTAATSMTKFAGVVAPTSAGYTVSTLPACSATYKGGWAYVTDALTPTYNAALTGGSSTIVPVFCNGTTWTSH